MTSLSVNVNKVALLRNTRETGVPDVVAAAVVCIEAGAHGITVHPRPDQRHITTPDVFDLAGLLAEHRDVEYNIEGNPFEGKYLELVTQVRPAQATLVPDTPGQRTSDHGWQMSRDGDRLSPIISQLRGLGIRVSVFMDPDPVQIELAASTGADRVELYTESYATACRAGSADAELNRFAQAAHAAGEVGLAVNAGHDLNLHNLGPFCAAVPNVLEVSIGHELIADAIWKGLADTVKAYLAVLGHG
jgi:pyridoxine 5-phosphate synthase